MAAIETASAKFVESLSEALAAFVVKAARGVRDAVGRLFNTGGSRLRNAKEREIVEEIRLRNIEKRVDILLKMQHLQQVPASARHEEIPFRKSRGR